MLTKRYYILLLLFLPFILSCEKDESNIESKNEPFDKQITAIAIYDTIVWVGTSVNGLYKFDGALWTSYTDEDGIVSDTVTSLVIGANGCLWVGTNMGLAKFENDSWTNFTTADGLYNNEVYSLACDQQNNIWIGTRKNRLTKYDGANFTSYYVHPDASEMGHIHTVTCDLEGNIWVGSCFSGLSKFDGLNWTDHINNFNTFVSSSICTAEGDLWIVYKAGAYKLSNNIWINYTEADGLVHDYVNCFASDHQNNIWIGTTAGLSKFNGTSWTSYTTSNGLLDNYITALACDKTGDIWIGTSTGLTKLITTK